MLHIFLSVFFSLSVYSPHQRAFDIVYLVTVLKKLPYFPWFSTLKRFCNKIWRVFFMIIKFSFFALKCLIICWQVFRLGGMKIKGWIYGFQGWKEKQISSKEFNEGNKNCLMNSCFKDEIKNRSLSSKRISLLAMKNSIESRFQRKNSFGSLLSSTKMKVNMNIFMKIQWHFQPLAAFLIFFWLKIVEVKKAFSFSSYRFQKKKERKKM